MSPHSKRILLALALSMRALARHALRVVVAAGLLAAGTPGALAGQAAADKPEPFDVASPSRKHGATIARVVVRSFARTRLHRPGRGRRVNVETGWSHQPQSLLVLDGATRKGRDSVKVLLATRPNGSTGWILRDHLRLRRTRYWVEVRTASRQVAIYRRGRRVKRFGAVVGAPGTPTPLGLAALYERNRQPNAGAFLGPWSLALTIGSNVLENYGGGPGRVAIHGRSGASLSDPLGSARSHGCIRISNRPISWMANHLPVGTPVRIRG